MKTSFLKRRSLSKPKKSEPIDLYELASVRARNRNRFHSLLLKAFAESGYTKADLAKMLSKKPEQITRWLSGPKNVNLDTYSDLIFALNGKFLLVEATDDLQKGKSNRQGKFTQETKVFASITTPSSRYANQVRSDSQNTKQITNSHELQVRENYVGRV